MEKPKFHLDSAVFYSNDINKIVDFYVNFVGLELEYRQGDKFASFLFEGGGRLGVKLKAEDREVPGAQTVFIEVSEIEPLYEQMKQKGAEIIKELQVTKGFGQNFSILDPDQNKVQFVKRT
jgi:predicted enzyme related to lactoylglutathione lyase